MCLPGSSSDLHHAHPLLRLGVCCSALQWAVDSNSAPARSPPGAPGRPAPLRPHVRALLPPRQRLRPAPARHLSRCHGSRCCNWLTQRLMWVAQDPPGAPGQPAPLQPHLCALLPPRRWLRPAPTQHVASVVPAAAEVGRRSGCCGLLKTVRHARTACTPGAARVHACCAPTAHWQQSRRQHAQLLHKSHARS